ncbi:hypothetical protein [Schaalia suimastitidis]|uniref:hypothetical protein n=1 Tax=Schaalia suimastitidis TaxID=121163 RepID=UPI000409AD3F|nr:hypothetical protein [Schaalia suimastitidis]
MPGKVIDLAQGEVIPQQLLAEWVNPLIVKSAFNAAKDSAGKGLIRRFSIPSKTGMSTLPSDGLEGWQHFISYNQRDVDVEVRVVQRLERNLRRNSNVEPTGLTCTATAVECTLTRLLPSVPFGPTLTTGTFVSAGHSG